MRAKPNPGSSCVGYQKVGEVTCEWDKLGSSGFWTTRPECHQGVRMLCGASSEGFTVKDGKEMVSGRVYKVRLSSPDLLVNHHTMHLTTDMMLFFTQDLSK